MNSLMIIASFVLLVVPVLYIVRVAQGRITPNPVTFTLRSVVAVMNLVSYFSVADKNLFKVSVSTMSTIGLIAILTYSFRKGKLSKVNQFDIASGIIAFAVAILWKVSEDPVLANLCLQSAMLITFVPAIRGVLAGVAREQVLPWALATLSYVIMTTALLLDRGTTWQQLIHPICVGFGGNGALALAIAYKNRR